jgi:aryl-alcohol dehydrogenase-like predicted oxidoreductase
MEYRQLGRTGLNVSVIGLGTMTFGEQNTEAEGHEQIDYALDHGVNLLDTAEMYAVPPRADTYGSTERILGTWFNKSGKRSKVVLATKVAGPGRALNIDYVRGGGNQLDRENIVAAVDASLTRLQTDYLDLYQLHWPDRSTNFFGRLEYRHDDNQSSTPIEETLETLDGLVRAGKVRHVGVSNETPWGVSRYLHLSAMRGWPRIASIQNPYNLLNRSFEIGLAEMSLREDVGLLAYSPLAFGVLTGKFLDGARPAEARVVRWSRFARYNGALAEATTARYVAIARRYGLEPAQMALAYVNTRPFVASNLIGATTMAQLEMNIASMDVKLSDEVIGAIDAVHKTQPNPCP